MDSVRGQPAPATGPGPSVPGWSGPGASGPGSPGPGASRRALTGHGTALPLLLVGGFRMIVDAVQHELVAAGHVQLRPVHGFALHAVDLGAATVAAVARGTGVSKQAAAKTVAWLEKAGYLHRVGHPRDGRSQLLRLTERGRDAVRISAAALEDQRQAWDHLLGAARLEILERSLVAMVGVPNLTGRVELPPWLSPDPFTATDPGGGVPGPGDPVQ